ncbi:MAG: hypothetical protein QM667_03165 [Asticcacaulis sp.]
MTEPVTPSPLWDQKRPTPQVRGAWFLFRWGPFGFWWPITWQGYLLMLIEGLCLGGGMEVGSELVKRGFAWGQYVTYAGAIIFVLLFIFSIRKTRTA